MSRCRRPCPHNGREAALGMLEVLVNTAADAIDGLTDALEFCVCLSAEPVDASTVLNRTALNKLVDVVGLLAI